MHMIIQAVNRISPKRRHPLEHSEGKQQKRGTVRSSLWEWIIALLIALAIALVLTQVVFVNAQIPSESMEDTIIAGDRVVGFRLAYLFDDPARGDIVIFRWPDDETQLYVKRIIGMPGDTVQVTDGIVFINGQAQPQLNEHVKGVPTGSFGPWTVPGDSYFMMGDNRNLSYDSRFWKNTFVARKAVVGRAAVRLFPNPGVLR